MASGVYSAPEGGVVLRTTGILNRRLGHCYSNYLCLARSSFHLCFQFA